MALWNINGNLVYTTGALSITPAGEGVTFAKRHLYTVPRSNIGKGAIITSPVNGQTYHVPSWTPVHPETTLEDIVMEEKPFAEIFAEPETWTFKSDTSDKTYTVKKNKNGNLSCDCWGYIAHKKCKHVKEVTLCSH
jgi:hypothetical protein